MYALDAFIVKLQYKFDKCTYQFVNVHARQDINPHRNRELPLLGDSLLA